MTILHLDSSILGAHSTSRLLSAQIVARLQLLHPGSAIIRHDLAVSETAHLTGDHVAVRQGGSPATPAVDADLAIGHSYIEDLYAADIIVIGAPMYNFSVATQLKTWIDRVCVADRTFRYTPTGPVGLLPPGKKVFIASTRGGVYSGDSPAASMDHQEAYLRTILSFMGVTHISVVRAEGLGMGEEAKAAALANAAGQIEALAA